MLLHGDHDTTVPYQESVAMAQELRRNGVECSLITVENGEHGFDQDYVGGVFIALRDHPNAERFQSVLAFLRRRCK
jgi:dipeptidyl aminopeptidase/acylaminoacyl peptidase